MAALLMAAGCARPQSKTQPEVVNTGHPAAQPSLAALPEIPAHSRFNTPRTHQGLLATREALRAHLPAAPHDRSQASLQGWVDDVVIVWVRERTDRIEHVRARFQLEDKPTSAEKIVTHAALGLLKEDTANVLNGLPAPAELDTEPEIAKMYREVVAVRAEPFLSAALLDFRSCAELAYEAGEPTYHWAVFCHDRFDRLKAEAIDRIGHVPELATRR